MSWGCGIIPADVCRCVYLFVLLIFFSCSPFFILFFFFFFFYFSFFFQIADRSVPDDDDQSAHVPPGGHGRCFDGAAGRRCVQPVGGFAVRLGLRATSLMLLATIYYVPLLDDNDFCMTCYTCANASCWRCPFIHGSVCIHNDFYIIIIMLFVC